MAEEPRCRQREEVVAAVLRWDSTTARDLPALWRLPSVQQHWVLVAEGWWRNAVAGDGARQAKQDCSWLCGRGSSA